MLNLLIGILLGVFGMVIIALHLAAANKPKKLPRSRKSTALA
jgi:capsular polysaccharide biosynthesis protein